MPHISPSYPIPVVHSPYPSGHRTNTSTFRTRAPRRHSSSRVGCTGHPRSNYPSSRSSLRHTMGIASSRWAPFDRGGWRRVFQRLSPSIASSCAIWSPSPCSLMGWVAFTLLCFIARKIRLTIAPSPCFGDRTLFNTGVLPRGTSFVSPNEQPRTAPPTRSRGSRPRAQGTIPANRAPRCRPLYSLVRAVELLSTQRVKSHVACSTVSLCWCSVPKSKELNVRVRTVHR